MTLRFLKNNKTSRNRNFSRFWKRVSMLMTLLERQIVVFVFIEFICWWKCFHRRHRWHVATWRSWSQTFYSPSLNAIKILGYSFWVYPFSTTDVDADFYILPHLIVV